MYEGSIYIYYKHKHPYSICVQNLPVVVFSEKNFKNKYFTNLDTNMIGISFNEHTVLEIQSCFIKFGHYYIIMNNYFDKNLLVMKFFLWTDKKTRVVSLKSSIERDEMP